MALTPEQISNLREQLKQQIEHLPEAEKAQALKQIEELSPEALESMLKQQSKGSKEKSVFRLIIEKQIPAHVIDENKEVIAVLEINPISQGHIIIIPKLAARNSREIPTKAFAMAKKLSKKLISKLKAKSTEIQTEFKFGEIVINIIPIYEESLNLQSPRKKAEKTELEALQKNLEIKKVKRAPKVKIIKQIEPQKSQVLKLQRKIP